MKRNILVTGGCGFIGSNFINNRNSEDFVVNIDRLDYCANENNVSRKENYTFVKGDINDSELVLMLLEKYHIDTVVHFAAQSHVDNSFVEWKSLNFTCDNVMGTHTLLECCRIYKKLHRFIHMSTDEVYGEVTLDHQGCCPERSILNPTNPYAATKAGAEMLVRSYNHSFGLPAIVMRCNNVYGPNQYPEKVIPKFVHQLKNNQKCTIHGTGQTRRNFIHAFDVATAIDTIIEKGKVGKIYNIGSNDKEYSVIEIAHMLIEKLKPGQPIDEWIEFVPDRYFNDFRYSIDSSDLRKLGWTDTISTLID